MFEELIDDMVGRIVEHCHPEAIIIFGSVTKGTATKDSDLDLMVIIDTDLPYFERTLAVRRTIGRTSIPMGILAFTPAEIEEGRKRKGIITEVLRTGKVVYGAVRK